MVKTLNESGSNLTEVIAQDLKQYSLGQVVKEIVELSHGGIWLVIDKEEEERRALTKTIESRLENLYGELDRREGVYNLIVKDYEMDRRRL